MRAQICGVWGHIRAGALLRAAFGRDDPTSGASRGSVGGRDDLERAKTRRSCRVILKLAPTMWFVTTVREVESTNNAVE